ncbi:hypothetical protein METESE_34260 [Mesoterricola sediminis]|uniref:Uncharacterized protein n=1 Tax=Mesoterricola sediminis TaxID=2927980 RepID=A0AA48HHT3_9BACT|nr:hypothetical protein METESE_34260 [Mesoterricola sediminis]
MPAPSSILLLHGLGGSGLGTVKLLEEHLVASGWDKAVYLRPTLQAVHLPPEGKPMDRVFVQAWDEMNAFLGTRVPHLTVGFSFGGLLSAFSPSPLRLSVCSPWAQLSADAIQRAAAKPGWRILHGGEDDRVPPGDHLGMLPESLPLTLDPAGTHDFDAWMPRIVDWVHASWDAFQEAR